MLGWKLVLLNFFLIEKQLVFENHIEFERSSIIFEWNYGIDSASDTVMALRLGYELTLLMLMR